MVWMRWIANKGAFAHSGGAMTTVVSSRRSISFRRIRTSQNVLLSGPKSCQCNKNETRSEGMIQIALTVPKVPP